MSAKPPRSLPYLQLLLQPLWKSVFTAPPAKTESKATAERNVKAGKLNETKLRLFPQLVSATSYNVSIFEVVSTALTTKFCTVVPEQECGCSNRFFVNGDVVVIIRFKDKAAFPNAPPDSSIIGKSLKKFYGKTGFAHIDCVNYAFLKLFAGAKLAKLPGFAALSAQAKDMAARCFEEKRKWDEVTEDLVGEMPARVVIRKLECYQAYSEIMETELQWTSDEVERTEIDLTITGSSDQKGSKICLKTVNVL